MPVATYTNVIDGQQQQRIALRAAISEECDSRLAARPLDSRTAAVDVEVSLDGYALKCSDDPDDTMIAPLLLVVRCT